MDFEERRAYCQNAYPVTLGLLKAIAYITMVIDHVAASLLYNYRQTLADTTQYNDIYQLLRHIGRPAFIIFTFLIAEGMVYSHNRLNYILRLAVFAVISEIPYDLALGKGIVDWEKQSVFVTLFLGAVCIYGIQYLREKIKNKGILFPGVAALMVIFGALGYLTKCDYKGWGVLLIVLFYLCRKNYRLMLFMCILFITPGYALHSFYSGKYYEKYTLLEYFSLPKMYEKIFFTEAYGLVSVFLLYFYRGQKGRLLPKYVYYMIYPGHLLVIGLIRYFWLGIG